MVIGGIYSSPILLGKTQSLDSEIDDRIEYPFFGSDMKIPAPKEAVSPQTLLGARDYLFLNAGRQVYEIGAETCHPYHEARILFRMLPRVRQYLFIDHVELHVMNVEIEPGFKICGEIVLILVGEKLGHEFLIE